MPPFIFSSWVTPEFLFLQAGQLHNEIDSKWKTCFEAKFVKILAMHIEEKGSFPPAILDGKTIECVMHRL